MFSASTRLAALALTLGAALHLSTSTPAAAQGGLSIRAEGDSAARIVPREPLSSADAALRTRDGRVALLLTDAEVVLQLTDRGLREVRGHASSNESWAAKLAVLVIGSALTDLLDHGMAMDLSTLRRARAEGNRLVLEDRDGHAVFGTVEVNDRRVMDDFEAADARRFADEVNRALRRHREWADRNR